MDSFAAPATCDLTSLEPPDSSGDLYSAASFHSLRSLSNSPIWRGSNTSICGGAFLRLVSLAACAHKNRHFLSSCEMIHHAPGCLERPRFTCRSFRENKSIDPILLLLFSCCPDIGQIDYSTCLSRTIIYYGAKLPGEFIPPAPKCPPTPKKPFPSLLPFPRKRESPQTLTVLERDVKRQLEIRGDSRFRGNGGEGREWECF